jgi:hypothetical protein
MSTYSDKTEARAALLEPLTDPSATTATVQATAQGLKDEAEAAPDNVDDLVWFTFSAFFEVVGRTPPERQGRLIELLTQLQQTKALGADGQVLKHGDGDGEVWADLPTFGWVARDVWNFGMSPFVFFFSYFFSFLHLPNSTLQLQLYLVTNQPPQKQTQPTPRQQQKSAPSGRTGRSSSRS